MNKVTLIFCATVSAVKLKDDPAAQLLELQKIKTETELALDTAAAEKLLGDNITKLLA